MDHAAKNLELIDWRRQAGPVMEVAQWTVTDRGMEMADKPNLDSKSDSVNNESEDEEEEEEGEEDLGEEELEAFLAEQGLGGQEEEI